eukprot:scaffold156994_cov17-Tisochrysis_lutea.AAC.1
MERWSPCPQTEVNAPTFNVQCGCTADKPLHWNPTRDLPASGICKWHKHCHGGSSLVHSASLHAQVHSSDYPLHWNMTKDLAIAFSIAMVGIVGNVLLVPFVRPDLWFEWPELDTEPALKTPPDNGVSTSGK